MPNDSPDAPEAGERKPGPSGGSGPGMLSGVATRMAPLPVERLLRDAGSERERVHILLITISSRLFYALAILLVFGFGILLSNQSFGVPENVTLPIIMLCGIVGGFVSIQRRLKDLTIEDLKLLADSRIYLLLAPLVGGVLAIVIYVIFLAELMVSDLFPKFQGVDTAEPITGFFSIFYQVAQTYSDYAKLMLWCFIAGFSESFVTNVIGRFEGKAVKSIE